MKNKLDTVMRVLAFVCLFVFALAGAGQAIEGNASAAYAYVCAAAWVVFFLVLKEDEPWT